MHLFSAKNHNVTRLNHKDEYYRDYYFNQKLSTGIALVARIEGISKKDAAELLMKAGLSSYMGDKVLEHIRAENAARELNQRMKMTRFVMILRRYAKEHGIDLSKVF